MRRLPILVTIVAVLAAITASAQVRTAYPDKRGVPLSAFPRTIQLADNVYGYEEIRQPGFTTVSLIVVGRDGVLIADGQGSPAATQKMLDEIRKITHPNSLAQIKRDAANPNRSATAPPLVVPPAAMSGSTQSIDVGGIEVRAMFLGRAHTGGDLMTYLPAQKILFMSEAYLNRVFPAMRSAYPTEWVAVIDKALAMDVDRYVPGHGFIEAPAVSREELVEFQKALKAVNAETKRLHDRGVPADDAVKQANWGPYADWFLRDQQAPIAVRKIYDELEGRLK